MAPEVRRREALRPGDLEAVDVLPEVLGAPENLPLEPVEHVSLAICSVIPSGVRCASARRLISEFMARWTLEKTKFRRWIACSAHVLRARGP